MCEYFHDYYRRALKGGDGNLLTHHETEHYAKELVKRFKLFIIKSRKKVSVFI